MIRPTKIKIEKCPKIFDQSIVHQQSTVIKISKTKISNLKFNYIDMDKIQEEKK